MKCCLKADVEISVLDLQSWSWSIRKLNNLSNKGNSVSVMRLVTGYISRSTNPVKHKKENVTHGWDRLVINLSYGWRLLIVTIINYNWLLPKRSYGIEIEILQYLTVSDLTAQTLKFLKRQPVPFLLYSGRQCSARSILINIKKRGGRKKWIGHFQVALLYQNESNTPFTPTKHV